MRCAVLACVGALAAASTDVVTVEYLDPSRKTLFGHRKATAKFCMPDGDGPFPLYVFGHGAGCAAADYQYFCSVAATLMVYHGSDLVFPADFDSAAAALDAKFLAATVVNASRTDASAAFYGKLNGDVVVGGHSMGGGMAGLAVGMDAMPAAGVAVFAPGTFTKPSAAPFLPNITAPTMVVVGAWDCDSNSLDKQARPFYDSVASLAKVLVVVAGANHCQWAEPREPLLGVCKTFVPNECHNVTAGVQQQHGQDLLEGFAGALRSERGWDAFEGLLAKGEAAGVWQFKSSKTSPSKELTNHCPCK
eukprot:TRINITY_DN851_c1_g1_i1.p1 TRINITY_DN851_c1_g1~~TRINITY_DN851_c1_g1_i1.p1  ORF type:complete len:305 (+),score=96.53 TRINITY_DN851_c1_g1_i1:50-964(+)